ncbi:MAG: hypothetical protein AAF500_22275 [Myxococcota bacterium]
MTSMTYGAWGRAGLLLVWCMSFDAHASAEDIGAQVTVEHRAEAADAYDQGTSAYLNGEYEKAAQWFERAFRLVPTSAALVQAIRSYSKAGNAIQAANLGLVLKQEYPKDTRALKTARAAIRTAEAQAVKVVTRCDRECTLELDGALIENQSFFVSPDVDHSIKAGFDTGEASSMVRGEAGSTKHVSLAAPLPPPPPPVPRWAFFSSLGATAALGAITIWSGLDANRGVDAFEAAARTANSPGINDNGSPSPADQAEALLTDGQQKERRTNILIGLTAGMAAGTAVMGIFTNWKNESREPTARRIEPAVGVTNRGGAVKLKGRF